MRRKLACTALVAAVLPLAGCVSLVARTRHPEGDGVVKHRVTLLNIHTSHGPLIRIYDGPDVVDTKFFSLIQLYSTTKGLPEDTPRNQ